jgi:hypothetical protein
MFEEMTFVEIHTVNPAKPIFQQDRIGPNLLCLYDFDCGAVPRILFSYPETKPALIEE